MKGCDDGKRVMWHALLFLQVTQPPISCQNFFGFCINTKIPIFGDWRLYHDFETPEAHGFQIKNKENTKNYTM
jgi:hypothetical protein